MEVDGDGDDDDAAAPINGQPLRVCTSCGQPGHLRSSNKRCPNYKPKAVNARKPAGVGQEAKVTSKISAGKFFINHYEGGGNVIDAIRHNIVPQMTMINAEGSRACLGFVLHRLEAGLALPNLSMGAGGVMRQFFAGMLGNQRGQQGRRNAGNDPEINAYIDQVYRPCRPAGMPWYDGSHLAQLITYQAQMFAANCCAYITVNLPRLLQRYVHAQLHQSLRRWNLPKQLFPAMANYVIRRLVNEVDVDMGEIVDTLGQGNYAQLTVIVLLEVWRV